MMKISKLFMAVSASAMLLFSCTDDDDFTSRPLPEPTFRAELYATNHNNGNITVYDLVENTTSTLTTDATDAEGIFYDPQNDAVTIATREPNVQLNSYSGITNAITVGGSAELEVDFTTSSEDGLTSPRDIAVYNDLYVVADNAPVDGNEDTGRFFIYSHNGGELMLRNIVTVDFKVWGIDLVGDDLYAVVDETNQLALFEDFTAMNTTDATVAATKTIAIGGIVRTHGIDLEDNTLVMTDIGDAASDSDGGFHIITDFASKFSTVEDGGMLPVTSQTRISGNRTRLGNPVNVVFSPDLRAIFIAELANNQVLIFSNIDVEGGNISPSLTASLEGVSSLDFYYGEIEEED